MGLNRINLWDSIANKTTEELIKNPDDLERAVSFLVNYGYADIAEDVSEMIVLINSIKILSRQCDIIREKMQYIFFSMELYANERISKYELKKRLERYRRAKR